MRFILFFLLLTALPSAATLVTGHRPTGRRVVKVAVAAYEPILQTTNGVPCNAPYWRACNWYAPTDVVAYAIAACAAAWDNAVEFKIVHWTNVNLFPHFMATDSGTYRCTNRWGEKRYRTDNEHYWIEYTSGWKWGGTPTPDAKMGDLGYWVMLTNDFPHLLGMVDRGEVDTIFTPGGPYFGMWETLMAGRGAYWCNSSGLATTNERLVVIGGIGYTERKGSGLHNYGHGLGESGLASWFFDSTLGYDNSKSPYTNVNDFVLFTRCTNFTDATTRQPIHCGNTHYAPNSTADYQYDSPVPVRCSADQWYGYPLMTNTPRFMNNADWFTYSSPYAYEDDKFQMWWWNHIPRYMGSSFANPANRFRKGHMNNWLSYLWNHNHVGFPIGSHQLVSHQNTDLRGWFSYRIYAPPGTTQIYIHATAGRAVRFLLRKSYVPVYRSSSVSFAYDDMQTGTGAYVRTINAANNYGRGVTGVWYLSFGGSGEAWNHNTYSQTVYVTILPVPTNTVTPIITITSPTADSVFDKAKTARAWIRWNIEAPSLPQGVRATYIAYQLTNGVSPWIPLCEDYIFNLQNEYEWTLPNAASTNARVMIITEDVYGIMYTNYSAPFKLNTQGIYAINQEWFSMDLPVSSSRDRHVALGADSTNYLYFTLGNATPSPVYRIPKGTIDTNLWQARAALPLTGPIDGNSGVGDMCYWNGYLWTFGVSNGGARVVYRYDTTANSWTTGGQMPEPDQWGVNAGIAVVDATKIFGGWIGWSRIKHITSWQQPTAHSTVGDMHGGASHPWDSCITTNYLYFLKHHDNGQQASGVFARINTTGTPTLQHLPMNAFNPGMGCALEYMPGWLFLDRRERIFALRGGTGSGPGDGAGWTASSTANQLGIYDIAAGTWSVTSLPFAVDGGSEMCRVGDILYILAANAVAQPLKLRIYPECGVLITHPQGSFTITGGMWTNILWNSGRVVSGLAASNAVWLTTNGLSGTWILLAQGDHATLTNLAWQAPSLGSASQCYFRVVQTWSDGTSFTNTSTHPFIIVPIPEPFSSVVCSLACAAWLSSLRTARRQTHLRPTPHLLR
ncbi:MAG: hypothetical protein N2595_01610 [bacterium]|nr:hypothetical protein [bacterium]